MTVQALWAWVFRKPLGTSLPCGFRLLQIHKIFLNPQTDFTELIWFYLKVLVEVLSLLKVKTYLG